MTSILKKLTGGIAAVAIVATAFISQQATAADPTFNATGAYVLQFEYSGSNYSHDLTLVQDYDGSLTGNGGYPVGGPYSYEWELTSGSVSGNAIEFTADYTVGADALTPLTTLNVTGTIAMDGSIAGSWSDNYAGGSRTGSFMTISGTAMPIDYTTIVVTGDTSAGENQPGWLFNRDASTDTPYEFNNDQNSIGDGSLYVAPISANAPDKFIGENFINEPIANVDFISYDFMIGSGGVDTEEEQFYMNVYANFGVSDDTKFYDCRYNVVPTVGSTSGFTTVTFDPTLDYPVTQSGTSPFACPASPSDMDTLSANSTIRVFALNVGDTSTSDEGLDGYLDNVVVGMVNHVVTYDFEMEAVDDTAPAAPVHLTPADGDTLTSAELDKVDWTDVLDDSSPVTYFYEVSNSSLTNDDGSFISPLYVSAELTASEIATAGTPEGTYYWHVRAVDAADNTSVWSNATSFTIDNDSDEEPTGPVTKDDCKNGGWKTFTNPSFKNQGQCVSYVATGRNQ